MFDSIATGVEHSEAGNSLDEIDKLREPIKPHKS